ncbi:MAG: VOC family protein, partial [Bryobacteraceae bacterium]
MPHTKSYTPGAFNWVELATSDQNAAKTFYTSLFGWDVVDNPIGPSEVYSIFKFQGVDSGAAYTMRDDE